jgi:hypothetical protein
MKNKQNSGNAEIKTFPIISLIFFLKWLKNAHKSISIHLGLKR